MNNQNNTYCEICGSNNNLSPFKNKFICSECINFISNNYNKYDNNKEFLKINEDAISNNLNSIE